MDGDTSGKKMLCEVLFGHFICMRYWNNIKKDESIFPWDASLKEKKNHLSGFKLSCFKNMIKLS